MRANFKEGRIFDKIIKTLAPNNGALMKRAIFKINFAVTRPQGFSTFEILRNESRELFFFSGSFPHKWRIFISIEVASSKSVYSYLFIWIDFFFHQLFILSVYTWNRYSDVTSNFSALELFTTKN